MDHYKKRHLKDKKDKIDNSPNKVNWGYWNEKDNDVLNSKGLIEDRDFLSIILIWFGIPFLLGGVFLTIGIFIIVNSPANEPAETIDYSKTYTKVTAVVKSVETKREDEYDVEQGHWRSYTTDVTHISYEVNGTHYDGDIYGYVEGRDEGDRIDVYYYNEDPRQVTDSLSNGNYNHGSKPDFTFLIIGAVILALALLILFFIIFAICKNKLQQFKARRKLE